ncbi:FecR domain-containing protein [Pseudomonas sp. 21LCFQ02]|uniref:FecR domain-containing protein n=1 Tax=unclassified Pseudomonas TaxID=196821 RepID=UPI00209BA3FE|nr:MULTISPECIES: FecR domain-containing protein [unclassified Pseudomonas]MCO8166413.1 FecR domain-containing protein [Pseudomonas sp. 21LCFQ02]MCQ9422568.1 FecR domain-containing protein [Pseudomonas sp. LJDD11]
MQAAIDHQALQQAAEWYAQLTGTPDDQALQQAWRQWLADDQAHRQAWRFVEQVSQRFAPLQQDVEQADQTLSRLRHGDQSRRRILRGLAGLSGLGVLGWLSWQGNARDTWQAWQADYRTGTAEIREQQLADGSRIWLNSGSALDVRFDDQQRGLYLYSGEVLISTGHDRRPLRVYTAQGSLQPLGTRFSVLREERQTRLCVFEGRVLARCADSQQQQEVTAGLSLSFDAQTLSAQTPALATRESWSRNVLLTSGMDLGSFIAELGRHRHGYLGIAPQVAHLNIMGAYPLHDTDLALDMLAKTLPVRIQRRMPWWVSVEPL